MTSTAAPRVDRAEAFNLFRPGVMDDPWELLARMRDEVPVHYSEAAHGWVLTRYDDVAAGFRDPRFTAGSLEEQVKKQLRGHDLSLVSDFLRIRNKMMLHNDGAEQRRLRKPANATFAKKHMDRFQPLVARITDELLDAAAAKGQFCLVKDFAEPLSTKLIAEIFAVPHADRETFQRWSDDVSRFFGESLSADVAEDARVANAAIKALEDYFLELLAERRRQPGYDLLSLFVRALADARISDEEVVAQCVLIMMAGHFSTIDQMGNTAHALLTHPEQLAKLRRDPSRIGDAVEEGLRHDPGVIFMARVAAEDVVLRGETIRAGDTVFLGIGAANRDPAMFFTPDAFELDRPVRKHLGFGFGPHQCIGASLARVEMQTAFARLFARFPELRLDPSRPAERKAESLFFRGFYTLAAIA